MSRLTISEAARRVGKSRQYLYKLNKDGVITFQRGDKAPYIDEAELFRVFGDTLQLEQDEPEVIENDEWAEYRVADIESQTQRLNDLHQRVALLESRNTGLNGELTRAQQQITDLRADKTYLQHKLDEAMNEIKKLSQPRSLLEWFGFSNR